MEVLPKFRLSRKCIFTRRCCSLPSHKSGLSFATPTVFKYYEKELQKKKQTNEKTKPVNKKESKMFVYLCSLKWFQIIPTLFNTQWHYGSICQHQIFDPFKLHFYSKTSTTAIYVSSKWSDHHKCLYWGSKVAFAVED